MFLIIYCMLLKKFKIHNKTECDLHWKLYFLFITKKQNKIINVLENITPVYQKHDTSLVYLSKNFEFFISLITIQLTFQFWINIINTLVKHFTHLKLENIKTSSQFVTMPLQNKGTYCLQRIDYNKI